MSQSWPRPGAYTVKAQARCATHPDKVSPWSEGKIVAVEVEVISTPEQPAGPADAYPGQSVIYCTGEATSTRGHPVQYRFRIDETDYPEFNYTSWQDTTCIVHTWDSTGTIAVAAQARCAVHTDVRSEWSEVLAVEVAPPPPPLIRFATSITRIVNGVPVTTTKAYDPAVIDTVGMFRPFSMSYHGLTTNGMIRAYKFFPLTPGIDLPGANVWTSDVSDTLRVFPNVGADSLASGVFRLAAQCRDDAGAESIVDARMFTEGVCQIVVNFDPDTELLKIVNTYFNGPNAFVDTVDFTDGIPDTVPDRSWLWLAYRGWDSPFDSSLCDDIVNECIAYQVQYTRVSELDGGDGGRITSTSRWLPDTPEDNNLFGVPDSTSMNIGSNEYTVRVRSVDEYGRPDGTPAEAVIVGNLVPTLETAGLENYDGTTAADGDTMVWYWLSPANLDPVMPQPSDTIDFNAVPLPEVVKKFYFVVAATGRDDPRENIAAGAGVKGWFYLFREAANPDILQDFGRSGFWADGAATNVLSDTVTMVVRYTLPAFDPDASVEAYRNLPAYLGTVYDFTIRGRDAARTDEFEQFMFLNGQKTLLNVYNSSALGRVTATGGQSFSIEMRPTARP